MQLKFVHCEERRRLAQVAASDGRLCGVHLQRHGLRLRGACAAGAETDCVLIDGHHMAPSVE